jgi:eukaryotic-like serine/threonine-protein kinase
VRVAALLGALAFTAFLALELGAPSATSAERDIDRRLDVLGLALCGATGVIAALPRLGDRFVLGAALVSEVVLCGLISTHVPWAGFVRTGHLPGITWVVPIVILMALLVPAGGRATLVTAALALATMPLGLAFLAATGRVTASPADLVISTATALVALAIAHVASSAIHRAARQAAAARRLGSYQLAERIGTGGMGEVWRARHALLARPAAVKLVRADRIAGAAAAREEALRRFTREAQVTASLRSPHTVELYDFGVAADGRLYYAMELLDGQNLEHFVYQYGPVEPRRAVHWLRQACHSLAEAHGRGLIHRDIKPANLFLCVRGLDHDVVKVLDFGLATFTRASESGADLTQSGARLGSPGYMAPEQVFGESSTPRTDLYALGGVAYWLLAGARPFEAEAPAELLRMQAHATPRALVERGHGVPAALEAIVMACLAKDPDARPRDAEELDARLAAAVPGEPWTEEYARAWWRAHAPAAGA